MKFGVFHVMPDGRGDPAVVAKHAEDLGFESYWVADHTIIPEHSSVTYPGTGADGRVPDYLWQIPDPLIALARAGATTRRIRLGTAVCLVAERNPILLAKQIATLDDACGGRVFSESAVAGTRNNRRSSAATSIIAGRRSRTRSRP